VARRGERRISRMQAAEATLEENTAAVSPEVTEAVSRIREAASAKTVEKGVLIEAMRLVEKKKGALKKAGLTKDWKEKLDGTWRLIFTAGDDGKGLGYVFFEACQTWRPSASPKPSIENGVFLFGIPVLTFSGPFKWSDATTTLAFTFDKLKAGPLELSIGSWESEEKMEKMQGPSFKFIWIDDQIVVARGRSGGLAVWLKDSD